jgi:hypothetical protein
MPDGLRACQGTFAQYMQMVAENGQHLFEAGQKIIASFSRTMSAGWAKKNSCETKEFTSGVICAGLSVGKQEQQRECVPIERRILDEALKKLEATHELSRLLLKLRWIGMEDEAKRLQAMVNTLPAEERGSVVAGPFSTD